MHRLPYVVLLFVLLLPLAARSEVSLGQIVVPLYAQPRDNARVCTGFFLRPLYQDHEGVWSSWLMSAGHCPQQIFLRPEARLYQGPWWVGGTQVARLDSAVYALSDWRQTKVFLPVIQRDLEIGETLLVMGYGVSMGRKQRPVLRNGICRLDAHATTGSRKGRMYCSPPVTQGMSGSPVVTTRGEIAGILTHTVRTGPQETASWFTDIHDALDFLTPLMTAFEEEVNR